MKKPRLASRPVPARRGLYCQQPVRPAAAAADRPRSQCFWRPWLSSRRDSERVQSGKRQLIDSTVIGKHGRYTHPVKLFWPKSKCFDHLSEAGEALLTSFPVQATISFYEESDSESEDDRDDQSHDSGIDSE